MVTRGSLLIVGAVALAIAALLMISGLQTAPTAVGQEPTETAAATESASTPDTTPTGSAATATKAAATATKAAATATPPGSLPSTGMGPGGSGSSYGWLIPVLLGGLAGAIVVGAGALRMRVNRS